MKRVFGETEFKSPCLKCDKRHRACHDTCVDFREARKQYEETKAKIRAAKERQQDIYSVLFRKW